MSISSIQIIPKTSKHTHRRINTPFTHFVHIYLLPYSRFIIVTTKQRIVTGITNTVGRILAGIIADHTKLDALTINNAALVISSILLFCEPFCTEYWSLLVFASLYGLCCGRCEVGRAVFDW